jgi:hypothetical protein
MVGSFGTAGVQPARNIAFQSATGFSRWKAAHKGSKYDFELTDIDGDQIPEPVVWADSTHTSPVAVNGWGVKGSRAGLYMRNEYDDGQGGQTYYAEADARHYGPFKDQWNGGSIKKINQNFGKSVIKPAYDSRIPKDDPAHREFRKKFPASKFADPVARLLVGNRIDAQVIQESGLGGAPEEVQKEAIRKAHGTRRYKTMFDAELETIWQATSAGNPDAQTAVIAAMEQVMNAFNARGGAGGGGADFPQ